MQDHRARGFDHALVSAADLLGVAAPGQPGGAVTVLVRPAAARLADEGSLRGWVQDIAYRGHGYDHLVRLTDGTRLAGVFAAERRQRGQEVQVRPDPGGCFAYPSNTGGPAEDD